MILIVLITATAGPASAACKDQYHSCVNGCVKLPNGSGMEECMGSCGLGLVDCVDPSRIGTSGGYEVAPNTTSSPPQTIGQPPNPVVVTQPPGETRPPKLGLEPPKTVDLNKQSPGNGSGTTPTGPTRVHSVYQGKPNPVGVNALGSGSQSGTTGRLPEEPMYAKGIEIQRQEPQRMKDNQKVQDLVKSWQQMVNDKNSVLFRGQTSRGMGSVGSK